MTRVIHAIDKNNREYLPYISFSYLIRSDSVLKQQKLIKYEFSFYEKLRPFTRSQKDGCIPFSIAQSARAVEYTKCISAVG